MHLQECKAVHYCIWFSALKVMVGVLGRRAAGRVHCVEAVFRLVTYSTSLQQNLLHNNLAITKLLSTSSSLYTFQ